MNKDLQELLEEFPELKEDEEKLWKVIQYLESSSPNIEISKEFKDTLKQRLDSIIELRVGKKKNSLNIFIPAFCALAIFFGGFLYYKDMWEYEQDIDLIDNESILSNQVFMEELPMLWQAREWIIEEENLEENVEILTSLSFSSDSIPEENNIDDILNDIEQTESYMLETEVFDNFALESTILEDDILVDDNSWSLEDEIGDVMSLLDGLFKEIDEESNIEAQLTNNINLESELELSFEDYCKSVKWFIVNTREWLRVCRSSWKECREEEYKEKGICEFVPLN